MHVQWLRNSKLNCAGATGMQSGISVGYGIVTRIQGMDIDMTLDVHIHNGVSGIHENEGYALDVDDGVGKFKTMQFVEIYTVIGRIYYYCESWYSKNDDYYHDIRYKYYDKNQKASTYDVHCIYWFTWKFK
eukprot:227200_1